VENRPPQSKASGSVPRPEHSGRRQRGKVSRQAGKVRRSSGNASASRSTKSSRAGWSERFCSRAWCLAWISVSCLRNNLSRCRGLPKSLLRAPGRSLGSLSGAYDWQERPEFDKSEDRPSFGWFDPSRSRRSSLLHCPPNLRRLQRLAIVTPLVTVGELLSSWRKTELPAVLWPVTMRRIGFTSRHNSSPDKVARLLFSALDQATASGGSMIPSVTVTPDTMSVSPGYLHVVLDSERGGKHKPSLLTQSGATQSVQHQLAVS